MISRGAPGRKLRSRWALVCCGVLGGASACGGEEDVVARFVPPPPTGEGAGDEPTGKEPEPMDPSEQLGSDPELLPLTGAIDVSDSALIAAQGRFYLFHTGQGISTKVSDDLLHWEPGPSVFVDNPEWIAEAVPEATVLWAPDVAFFGGVYHLYYAVSTFAGKRSCIGHATSEGLGGEHGAGKWVDRGSVICSNVETDTDDWNAIDPHVLVEQDGSIWLVFGSFLSGIHLIRLDETGQRADDTMTHLAARPDADDAVQAPTLLREGDHYYLFTSIDFCCRGVVSTRAITVGRATSALGPYVDQEGRPMLEGGGSLLLEGDERWRGPGGSSVFRHEDRTYHLFHAYDAEKDGQSTLRISELLWDADAWPRSAGP